MPKRRRYFRNARAISFKEFKEICGKDFNGICCRSKTASSPDIKCAIYNCSLFRKLKRIPTITRLKDR